MLGQMISQIPKIKIDLTSVQTNIIVFDISRTGIKPEQAMVKLAKKGLWVVPFGASQLRAVTHLDVNDEDIARAGEILRSVFGNYTG